MEAVELPFPAAIVTKIMRSSGCNGGGGVTRVELLGNQSEREACSSSSFHQDTDDKRNVNGSRGPFWNMSEEDLFRQANEASSIHNEETFIDHDTSKQSQRKSVKSSRNNINVSRRSRSGNMEASLNVTTGVVDVNDHQSKELGSYPGKFNVAEKMHTAKQKISVSGKRSDKRNSKVSRSKSDSFSVKAGLSSFSSAAGGNNILGAYGSKHDICDLTKHVDELSLKALLDGSCKHPKFIKEKEKEKEILNGSILSSVREACSVFHLQNPNRTPNVTPVDASCNNNNSNNNNSGPTANDVNKADAANPASSNKVENSSVGPADVTILKFPLFAPKDVLSRLSLPPPKDLDLMLLDSMKPTSTSKVQNGGSLPTFSWSHISGGHFKANHPDAVKSTPSKTICQARWARMRAPSSTSTTTYLADFESLTYNQSLVPLKSGPTEEREKSPPLPPVTDIAADRPSGTRAAGSKSPGSHSGVVLSAAQTLCDIASRFRKQLGQNGNSKFPQKKPSQKPIKPPGPTKLTSDEKLEKALFTIPNSHNHHHHINPPKKPKISNDHHHHQHLHHSSKSFKNSSLMEASGKQQNHESTSGNSTMMKRSITTPPANSNKPSKLRKLVPMEWKMQKGNGKY